MNEDLLRLRADIDALDEALLRTVAARRAIVVSLAAAKARLGLPPLDPSREAQLDARWRARALELEVEPDLASALLAAVLADSRAAVEAAWSAARARLSSNEGPRDT